MTAATIPRMRAADEPVRICASLDGAVVVAAAVADVRVADRVDAPKVSLLVEVNVAVLNVEFRIMAVPVPAAVPMLVMVELLAAVVVELEPEPARMVKRPE